VLTGSGCGGRASRGWCRRVRAWPGTTPARAWRCRGSRGLQDSEQVHGVGPAQGGPHGLAVHGQHPPTPAPTPVVPVRPPGQSLPQPRPDGVLQRGRVDRGQQPPQRGAGRDRAGQPQVGARADGQVSDPLPDRGERSGPGEHRAHDRCQQWGEGVAHAPTTAGIGHYGERGGEVPTVTFSGWGQFGDSVRDVAVQHVGHGRDGGRWHRRARLSGDRSRCGNPMITARGAPDCHLTGVSRTGSSQVRPPQPRLRAHDEGITALLGHADSRWVESYASPIRVRLNPKDNSTVCAPSTINTIPRMGNRSVEAASSPPNEVCCQPSRAAR
jgi:hypothetical protein